MYTFNCITSKRYNKNSENLLRKACEKKEIPFVIHYSEVTDYSGLPQLTKNDLLYRITVDYQSQLLEKLLINQDCISFYNSYETCITKADNVIEATLLHNANKLSIIPTAYPTNNEKDYLKKTADQLGGFPLVVKVTGGSHGVGVMRVDSLESLYSITDFLVEKKIYYMIRKFIDYQYHARLIVLGEKVAGAIRYHNIKEDFRSNVGDNLHVETMKFPASIEQTAIQSCKVLGFEFGGVDILIEENGNHYIAEVNMPCYFPRCEMESKTPISEMMVDYLIEKAKRVHN